MQASDKNAKKRRRLPDISRLCAITSAKYNERLRDAFGLWFHIAVEECEFLSADSGSDQDLRPRSSHVLDLEESMSRSTRSWLGPFYQEPVNPRRAIGDIEAIAEMEEEDAELSSIKEVYLRQHRKLVAECAEAHTQLMQTCSVRLVIFT